MANPAEVRKQDSASIGFNLGAIALVLIMGGLGIAYIIDGAGKPGRTPAAEELTLTRTLGGKDLEIPQSWFRYAEQRVEGFAKQIDLQLALPLGPDGRAASIEVTLLPKSRARPSAGLLDGVYLHQFMPEQLAGPPGLVGKPLYPGDGFDGETVWYDPLSGNPFVAKCSAPIAEGDQPQCLRTVHLGPGIAAVYTFGAEILANWRSFDTEIDARLRQIGVF